MNLDGIKRAISDYVARVAPVVDPATTRDCDGYPLLSTGITLVGCSAISNGELEAWRTAPSDTASASVNRWAVAGSGVLVYDGTGWVKAATVEEAEAEADERDAFVYLFGCCGDPGDCGECGR